MLVGFAGDRLVGPEGSPSVWGFRRVRQAPRCGDMCFGGRKSMRKGVGVRRGPRGAGTGTPPHTAERVRRGWEGHALPATTLLGPDTDTEVKGV